MNSKKLEKFALKLSVFGTLFMSTFGISFGLWIQSEAILLDGFFNFISLIMALATLWVSWLIVQPNNEYFQFDYLNFIPLVNVIKGLLILTVSLFALASSVIAILSGGKNMDAGLAVVYGIIAAGGCLIIALIQRHVGQKTGSTMVIVDGKNWLVNGLISLSVAIAFTIVVFIKGSSFEWFVPYSDSTIVILVVLASIGVPIQIVIQNVNQLLLAAPSSKIQTELKGILATVMEDLPCDRHSLRMTETGQYIYVYLLWLLPQQETSKKVEEIDRYRSIITQTLREYNKNLNLDIIFTEDKAWFETRIKNFIQH
ncbi:MAG: cation transporter [Prochloraceae cyanobacterium]|nr:cation transporter [Prochloraceae cyanobacterium]